MIIKCWILREKDLMHFHTFCKVINNKTTTTVASKQGAKDCTTFKNALSGSKSGHFVVILKRTCTSIALHLWLYLCYDHFLLIITWVCCSEKSYALIKLFFKLWNLTSWEFAAACQSLLLIMTHFLSFC